MHCAPRTSAGNGARQRRIPKILVAAAACSALVYSVILLACSDEVVIVGTDLYFPLVYGDAPTASQLTALGRAMFFDAGLSASGKMSCASCHSPAHAYGPPDARIALPGGPQMNRSGFRNTPSLRYLHSPIAFTEHFYEIEVTGGKDDEGPTGGRTWDGRVNTGHDQALMPLLDRNEMANADTGEVISRLRKASYAEDFRKAVSAPGEDVFDNPDAVIGWLTVAIEMFEQSVADFHPFTSKYDAYLRDEVELSAKEKRGLLLFNDEKKGNCASCHASSHKNPAGRPPIFTDFGFVALGVPRNKAIPANADPKFFDLGLCGPMRTDLKDKPEYCGLFRTPSLRNVALRKSFFHNGQMHSLKDVVEFYVTRDITPQKWYPRAANGSIDQYNDLPEKYRENLNTDPPFAPLKGNRPRLNAAEIDDIVAFLGTLTDGYAVKGRAATTVSATAVATK
jgi:cytochrome c peroxidase